MRQLSRLPSNALIIAVIASCFIFMLLILVSCTFMIRFGALIIIFLFSRLILRRFLCHRCQVLQLDHYLTVGFEF